MTLAPVLTQCFTCRSPQVKVINGWMKAGVSDIEISRRLQESGNYVSRISLGKHRRKHLMTPFEQDRQKAADELEAQAKTLKAPTSKDLAVYVRDITLDRLEKKLLEPTIAEGLRAQEMIDRRLEKGADRDLLLQLAQVLGGAAPFAYIEGEYREVPEFEKAIDEEIALLTAG